MLGRALLIHACALSVCVVALGFALPAAAHDARPLSINIAEQSDNLFIARIRVPPTVPAENQPRIAWPDECAIVSDDKRRLSSDGIETTTIRCKTGLEGQHIKIAYHIFNPSLPTFLRLHKIDGKVITRVLPPDQLDWEVPNAPGWLAVATGYLRLGIEHIWAGIDHLLFVTGLLLLARTMRRVFLAITGFTIAHSITLSLSALNLVTLPGPPVEAAIALSILFLAREIAQPFPQGLAARFPIMVSSSFGLLHGFGFAAALREVGLPAKDLAAGLLCFNLGVEVGQIVFILGLVAVVLAIRKVTQIGGMNLMPPRIRLSLLGGYGLGVPAAFWFIQRLGAF